MFCVIENKCINPTTLSIKVHNFIYCQCDTCNLGVCHIVTHNESMFRCELDTCKYNIIS